VELEKKIYKQILIKPETHFKPEQFEIRAGSEADHEG
jgi:hypothetical protein